jgi:50S ribosomal protein L16 3-hydroxylase
VVLTRLLGDFPAARFLGEFYFRLPFPRPGGAAGIVPTFDDERIRALVEAPGADVMLSRRGVQAEFKDWRRLHAEGHTITVRHAEKSDPELARLAREFHDDFLAPVNIHLYHTPAGEHGFGWHYDVEDVFILQSQGVKTYSLRKNTVNPWPIQETMPRDLQFEREGSPVFTCRLAAGDWLYIPAGWWHIAKSEEASTSLAVGMMSPTALDLLKFLEPGLAASVIWRQRLPVAGEGLAQMMRDLGRDLSMVLSDPTLADKYVSALKSREGEPSL